LIVLKNRPLFQLPAIGTEGRPITGKQFKIVPADARLTVESSANATRLRLIRPFLAGKLTEAGW
jgi:hypothetical protein